MPVSGSNYNEIQNSAKMQLNANDLIFNSTGNEGDVVWTTEGYTTINYIPDMEFAQTEKFVDLSTQLSVAVTNPSRNHILPNRLTNLLFWRGQGRTALRLRKSPRRT